MNENDWEDFKESVIPIQKNKIVSSFKKKAILKENEEPRNEINISHELEIKSRNVKKFLEKNIHKKILKGKIQVDSTLDLHGCTIEESKVKVVEFIHKSLTYNKRLLLIITGKGERGPVTSGWAGKGKLKENVPKWLDSDYLEKHILWFDNAPPQKGGNGALLVYLRKFKE